MRRTAIALLCLLIPVILASPAFAVELRAPAAAQAPVLRVLDASDGGLRLVCELSSLGMEEFTVDGTRYQALSLPEGAIAGADGQPGLPTFTRFIALPAGRQARVVRVTPTEQRLAGIRVLPVQPDGADHFVIDRAAAPAVSAPGARLGEPALMHALRLVPLELQPVGYDAARGELRVAERLEVELEFLPDPAAPAAAPARLVPESFDRLYRDLVVNLEQSELYRAGDAAVGPGTYLLIYPDVTGVLTRLQPLIDLRKRQGYNVLAVATTTTGTSTASIKSYIQNLYNSADPPLEFVTLAGDATGTYVVNTWNESLSGYNGEGDHYYSLLSGGDILADVHVGRLSYRSGNELDIIINKILTYETNPPLTDSAWFTRASLCGDPSQSGVGVVYVNQWVKTQLLAQGYTQVDTIWSGNYASQMAINANRGLSAFGYRGWLGMSGMTSSSILALTNGMELPFALVVTCATGSFKSDATAISEAWTKAANGGGIGAVGTATTGTHTRYNNTYYKGCWDGALNGSDHRLGVAHTRGKYELYRTYQLVQPNQVEIWSMWNNLMGDPATDMYTGFPAALSVAYPATLPGGANALPVTVMAAGGPVVGARVTAYRSGALRVNGYTDAQGQVVLALPTDLADGSVLLTVTGHNLFAHLGSLTIGALPVFATYAGHQLDDDAAGASLGDGDGRLGPGERVELALALENLGSSPATGVSAKLESDDPYVELLTTTQSFGDIPAGGTVWGQSPYVLALAPGAPDGHLLDLVLTVTSGLSTWTSLVELEVASAALELQSVTWSAGAGLDPGESGTLSLSLLNGGTAPAAGVSATLISHSPWVSVTDAGGSFPDFAAGGSGNNAANPFALSVAGSCFPGHLASLSLLLSYNERAVQEVEIQLTVGAAALGSPTGPCAYGYYAFESTDTNHPQAPVYSWVELAPGYGGSGTSVGLTDFSATTDDTNILPLPFTFRYFGQDFDTISICSNGWVAMGTTYLVAFRNYPIPCSGAPPYLIAPFWDNLYQTGSDLVYYLSDTANHRYIVQWSRLRNEYNSGVTENFELILLDPAYYPTATGDGEIIFQYHTVNNIDGENGYATVGIMNGDRTDGLLLSYWNQHPASANNPAAGRAVRFLPLNDALQPEAVALPASVETTLWIGGTADRVVQVQNTGDAGSLLYFALDTASLPDWLRVLGATGSVPAGGSAAVQLRFDAEGLTLGTYETTLAINTNDEPLLVPVTLIVNSDGTAVDAAPAALVLGQNFPNPFNPATAISFGLPAAAAVRLTVFDVNGRAVATLVEGTLPAGWHDVTWDGRDAQGAEVAAGVYLYRLDVGAERIQKKMLLVK